MSSWFRALTLLRKPTARSDVAQLHLVQSLKRPEASVRAGVADALVGTDGISVFYGSLRLEQVQPVNRCGVAIISAKTKASIATRISG